MSRQRKKAPSDASGGATPQPKPLGAINIYYCFCVGRFTLLGLNASSLNRQLVHMTSYHIPPGTVRSEKSTTLMVPPHLGQASFFLSLIRPPPSRQSWQTRKLPVHS